MPFYFYKAKDPQQNIIEGCLFAEKKEDVYSALKEKNLHLVSYNKPFINKHFTTHKTIAEQLKEWFFFLSQMLENGLSLIDSLYILEKQTKRKAFKKILMQIIFHIEQGSSVSQAFEQNSKIFKPFIMQTLRIYEKTGELFKAFDVLYKYINDQLIFKQKLYASVRYPFFLCLFFITIFVIFNIYFIPELLGFLQENQMPTEDLDFLLFLHHHSFFILQYGIVTLLTFFIILLIVKKTTPKFYQKLSRKMYTWPFIKLFVNMQAFRFFQTLGIMLQAELNLNTAFDQAKEELSWMTLKKEFQNVKDDINSGTLISTAFQKRKFMNTIIIRFLEIGEKSGNLPKNILLCCKLIFMDMNNKLDKFIQYLQPTLILFVGATLLWTIKIFLLPLYNYAPEISG
jgi:type II secretory pathway component PulF